MSSSSSSSSGPRQRKRAKLAPTLDNVLELYQSMEGCLQGMLHTLKGGEVVTKEMIVAAQDEIEQLNNELEEQTKSLSASDTSGLSPSQLNAENLKHAKGGLEIHNRDSGVARHELFYLAVKAAKTQDSFREMQDMVGSYSPETETIDLTEVAADQWTHLLALIESNAKSSTSAPSKTLEARDTMYSALLTNSLNESNLPFVFSHHHPCFANKFNEDVADIGDFFKFKHYGETLNRLLGFNKVKKFDRREGAKWQLCGCTSEAFESRLFGVGTNISFGLTIEYNKISLFGLHWEKKGKGKPLLEHSLLLSAFFETKKACKTLLQTYFLCLAMLADRDREVSTNVPVDFCPLLKEKARTKARKKRQATLMLEREVEEEVKAAGGAKAEEDTKDEEEDDDRMEEKVVKMYPKVFKGKSTDTMYKVYDYGTARLDSATRAANLDQIKVAHNIAEKDDNRFELLCDKKCGVYVLKTPWFEGGHEPKLPEHVALLCDQLQLLHDQGMKHSDVLCQNLVFGGDKEKPTTHLIDFDYAHLASYPRSWNSAFKERHPLSLERQDIRPSHDIYAAIAILCTFFQWSDKTELYTVFADGRFTKEKHPQLLRAWAKASAAKVALWIRKHADKLVLVEEATTKILTAGSPPERKV